MILRKLALAVYDDDIIVECLIHHCLDRLAMLVIVLTFVLVRLHIDALLLLGFDDDGVVELGGGRCPRFTVNGRIVCILVVHAAVILIVERLAQIDLERLQPAVHHL